MPGDGSSATLAAVDAGLELRLTDGRHLRLAGVEPAAPTPDAPDLADTTRVDLADLVGGQPLQISTNGGKPDRWGRVAAIIAVSDATAATSLNEAALAAGLGRYLPETAAHGCRDALLAAERSARAGRRGVWRDAYYGVLGAQDRDAFRERSATSVVAEGRVAAVEAGPFRTLLRFAADGPAGANQSRDTLAGSILPRVVKLSTAQGVDLFALAGRRVRLRGLLDTRFGPRVELAGPDALEMLDPGATPVVAGGGG